EYQTNADDVQYVSVANRNPNSDQMSNQQIYFSPVGASVPYHNRPLRNTNRYRRIYDATDSDSNAQHLSLSTKWVSRLFGQNLQTVQQPAGPSAYYDALSGPPVPSISYATPDAATALLASARTHQTRSLPRYGFVHSDTAQTNLRQTRVFPMKARPSPTNPCATTVKIRL